MSTCENDRLARSRLSSCVRLTLFQSRAKASSDRAKRQVIVVFTHGPLACAPLDRAVRAAASRLIAVARSLNDQASPVCNSGLSAKSVVEFNGSNHFDPWLLRPSLRAAAEAAAEAVAQAAVRTEGEEGEEQVVAGEGAASDEAAVDGEAAATADNRTKWKLRWSTTNGCG